LNIFDPETEAFEVLRAKDLPGIRGTVIVPMLIDPIRQKAWLNAGYDEQGNAMDLYEMDIPSRKCRLVYFRDKSKQLIRSNLLYAHFHPYKDGLLLWDEARGLFEMKWDSLYADLQVSMKAGVGGWDMDEDRYMFFHGGGEANFTFENMSGKWVKVPHHLDSFFYSSKIYNEKDQTHWVSTKYELIHYAKNFQRIKTYGQEDGFNSLIMNMQPDHAGNIWFANKLNQIGRLDFTTGTISYLSETDGIRNIKFEWFTPVAKDARGDIYFGSGAWVKEDVGLYRVRPEKYLSAPASYVYLRSLKVNQKPFPLTRGINNLEELTLRFNQNTLTIETGIIDYYSKGKGRIRYRLESEGRNEAWQYGPAYSLIRYDGLTPGNYRLVLQSSNAGNEFNGPEKVLSIIIHPPFWATWWFRVLTVLALISGVYAIIQYRSRNLRRRNMELEEKVYHRTIELKHSLEELRETQEQLIHREKMASLGELTAGIAHEIQNPLNFVNNFSDLNAELIHELKEDLDRGNLTEARKVADDIFENEHKINHHGKRADSIVKGMLQHSRVGTGQKEMTDINALVAEYLRISYHGLRAKDKTFHAVAHTDLDERIGKINIIPQDIGRVLLNLYNNAFDAVTERSKLRVSGYEPTVTVTTKQVGAVKGNAGSLPRSDVPDTQFVVISVQDNGKGIPEKIRTKIFQPFFTTKPAGQGTGLGLSLSYDIIKAHRGELRMETTEGEGSVFIIQLPAKEMN
jgi:signal transduction histidine kinase